MAKRRQDKRLRDLSERVSQAVSVAWAQYQTGKKKPAKKKMWEEKHSETIRQRDNRLRREAEAAKKQFEALEEAGQTRLLPVREA